MPAAVPDLCACVIRVDNCLDYGSLLFAISLLGGYRLFSPVFPVSALQPSPTCVLVSSTGNISSSQEASRNNRLPFLCISTLRSLALNHNKPSCDCKTPVLINTIGERHYVGQVTVSARILCKHEVRIS